MDSLFNFDPDQPNEAQKPVERADIKTRFQPGNPGGPGRPAIKLNKRDYRIIEGLVISGVSNEKIAEIMGWNEDTFYVLKNRDARFSELLALSKEKADMQVTASLFKRATGYRYRERKVKEETSEEGFKNSTEITHKEMPPDVRAAQLWLMNRDPNKWKEKPNGDLINNNNVTINHNIDWQAADDCEPLQPYNEQPAGEAGGNEDNL